MTRSMLQRIRPRSYWYLSDHADQQEHSHIGQILEESSLCCASKEETEDTMKMTASPCFFVEEEKTKPNIKLSLEDALEIQATYTSWSHSIWEPNFEDADGEIVFEFGESELENGDITLKKSVDTADTEEETNPSCSSPTPQQLCQTRIELDALELSDIIDEDFSPIKANSARKDNDGHTHCDLLAFSADLRSHFLIDRNKSRLRALETSTNVNKNDSDVLLIEESFDLSQDSQQDTSICSLNAKNRKRSIRFADEEGKAMETVHLVERQQGYRDDSNLRRILVLLLLPKEKKFEFLHAEYSLNARVSVSVLLKQFPDMATDPIVASQEYTRLCRAGGGAELINALAIQDYGLEQDEILIAVVKGYTSKETNRMAKTLVENQQILKAVKRRNRYAHTLHSIKSNNEFRIYQAKKERDALEEEMMWKQQVAIELERQRSRRRSRNEEFGILEIEIPLLSNHHHDSSELTEEPTAKTNRHARLSRYHRQINQQTAPEPIEELSPDEEREDEASVCQTRDDEEGTDQKRDFDEDIDEHDSTQDEVPVPDTQQPKQKSRNIFGFTKRKSSRRTSDKSANSPNQRSNNYSEPTKKLGKFARKRWEQFRSIGTRKRTGGKA